MPKLVIPRKRDRITIVRGDYHPGALTTDTGGLKHDDQAPMSERVVVDSQRPTLYDANERPLYRKIGF